MDKIDRNLVRSRERAITVLSALVFCVLLLLNSEIRLLLRCL